MNAEVLNRRGLCDLPNELLLQVFDYLAELGVHPPRHSPFHVFNVLGGVNRRLKEFMLAYWQQRHQFFHTCSQFGSVLGLSQAEVACTLQPDVTAVISSLPDSFSAVWDRNVARTFQLGRIQNSPSICSQAYRYPKLRLPPEFYKMPNLESWIAFDMLETPLGMSRLAEHLPHLEHLGILWALDDHHPAVESFPNLRSLRMLLGSESYLPCTSRPLSSNLKSSTLTTLAIYDTSYSSNLISTLCSTGSRPFPSLRTLRLKEIKTSVIDVYGFISRHTSLHEVTASFTKVAHRSLRLEALIKLIQGTGLWVPTDGAATLVDQPSFDEYVADDPRPLNFFYNFGAFYEFAFSRAPLPGFASVELGEPQYKCTGLAVEFLDADEDIQDLAEQMTPGILSFLESGETPECLRDIEELRLSSAVPQDTTVALNETFINDIELQLRDWPNLSKLSLHWPITKAYWRCAHRYIRQFEQASNDICRLCNERAVPFLDELTPQFYNESGKTMTLAALRDEWHVDTELLEPEIRNVLHLDADTPLDADDPSLLLWAWEARNYPMIATAMRRIAETNLLLEEFEWYVVQGEDKADVVLWKWRIFRKPDGSVKLVVGNLSWTGCARGDPPPFLVLLGQELELTVRDAECRWRRRPCSCIAEEEDAM